MLKILEISIHLAIPNLEDMLTNNGVQNPVIPNLNPYISKISHIGIPLLYNINPSTIETASKIIAIIRKIKNNGIY